MVATRNSIKTIRNILLEELGKETSLKLVRRFLPISRQTEFKQSVQRLIESLEIDEEPLPPVDIPKL